MVAGRFPSGGRADPLALPAGLGRGTPPTAEMSLAEERRLGYVAMTRARDELVLSHAADYGGSRARRVSPFVLEALDLPAAAGVPGAGARASTPVERLAGFAASAVVVGHARRTDHRAAVAELLPGRRLPDLPAQVQVRPRPARPAGAAPCDRLRGGAPQGRPDVPSPARQGPRDERGRARRGVRVGLVERRVHEPRSRGGPAGGRSCGAPALPSAAARARRRDPDLRRARVQLQPRRRPRPWPLGPRRCRPGGGGERGISSECGPDGRRRLTDPRPPRSRAGDDHRLQVVRRPRSGQGSPARPRVAPAPDLRDGLRGDDRPAARRAGAPLPRIGAGRQGPGGPEAAGQGTGDGSPRPLPGCAPATTLRSPTTSPAPGAHSAISVRRASPADRSSSRLDSTLPAVHRSAPSRGVRGRSWGSHRRCSISPG